VVVLGSDSEPGKNGKDMVVLDWFEPPETTTSSVVELCVEGKSPRMELYAALHGQ
jgi:hypothetical protein